MAVLPLMPERRKRRSEETYTAITYQLEHIFRLHDLRNFTLSDANGLILAHAGHVEESEAIAAYAPVLAKCFDRTNRNDVVQKIADYVPHLTQQHYNVRSFFIDGDRLFLGIIGENKNAAEAAIYRALTGIRRIYKQSIHEQQVH